jgi:hypothetical protein
MRWYLALAAATALCLSAVRGDDDPKYNVGDPVRVFATHVGPVANPSETYPFYVLPFCAPREGAENPSTDLGESFSGDRRVNTPFEFRFMQDQDEVEVCERDLNEDDIVSLALRQRCKILLAR